MTEFDRRENPERYVDPIRVLLVRALEIIAHEQPEGFERFVVAGGASCVGVRVDDEDFVIDFTDMNGVHVGPPSDSTGAFTDRREPTVRIASDRQAIIAVLAGTETLISAVSSAQLEIVGSVAEISALHDALVAFMHAAVRCPSMPELLARLTGQDRLDVS